MGEASTGGGDAGGSDTGGSKSLWPDENLPFNLEKRRPPLEDAELLMLLILALLLLRLVLEASGAPCDDRRYDVNVGEPSSWMVATDGLVLLRTVSLVLEIEVWSWDPGSKLEVRSNFTGVSFVEDWDDLSLVEPRGSGAGLGPVGGLMAVSRKNQSTSVFFTPFKNALESFWRISLMDP